MRAFLLLSLLAAPAVAHEHAPVPQEAALERRLLSRPDDMAAMANLARVYAKSGRAAKAERLYRDLLRMEDMPLERAGGAPVSSRWLAGAALKSLRERPQQVASR